MDDQLKDRVFGIIERTVGVNPATLDADRDIREQVSLDSMQFVMVSAAVEKELGVELPLAALRARTVSEFLQVVEQTVSP
jgi:acyl carrier protein